jgi:hypothetical protein
MEFWALGFNLEVLLFGVATRPHAEEFIIYALVVLVRISLVAQIIRSLLKWTKAYLIRCHYKRDPQIKPR